ncbi:hypothetical protein EDC01DRAFT_376485 [Geopyxis carbonaria]|nr:hypothetical protein EDC01DRAFT_376485 [Geopyxis carbonaria]
MLLGKNFTPIPISETDIEISLIAWGFTLGFGFLTAWKAWKQTMRMNRTQRYRSAYFWLVWAEVLSNAGYGCGSWLYLKHHVQPGFFLFFSIYIFWAIQVQAQLQIIINRISVVLMDTRKAAYIRWSAFSIMMVLILIVSVVWIPACLQIAPIFIKINTIFDRVEKSIYMVIDASLNWYFVRVVKRQLLDDGLAKYKPLVDFNVRIVLLSICMDLLIIAMMSYPNPYVYLQFHPLAFTIKLNIELTMANLIAKLAKKREFANSSSYPSVPVASHATTGGTEIRNTMMVFAMSGAMAAVGTAGLGVGGGGARELRSSDGESEVAAAVAARVGGGMEVGVGESGGKHAAEEAQSFEKEAGCFGASSAR